MYYLAIRQLLSRKKQTLLILLGISFGTMIYVLIAGVQLGFRQYLQDELLNSTSHVIIKGRDNLIDRKAVTESLFAEDQLVQWVTPPAGRREESRLENYLGWQRRLSAHPEVMTFAPRLAVKAIATLKDSRVSLGLTGIVPEKHVKITKLESYMKEGSFNNLSGGAQTMVLGSGVLESLGAKVGDTILVSNGEDEAKPFKIVGKIHFGNPQADDSIAFSHLRDVQQLNKSPGRISEIMISLYNIDRAQELADQWDLFSRDTVESWQEANAAFMSMIKIQDVVRMIITLSILLVAGFGIYNVLSIMISQKQKEIAILRSIGYAPQRILQLFLIQGLVLGVLGGGIGLIIGFLLNLYFESIDLGIEIGQGTNLMISYDPSIFITAFSAALLASFIASYLPAKKASELTPIEIIRAS